MTADIFATGGNLDTGFNGSGKSVFNIESSPAPGSFAEVVVIDGNKFLVVGRAETGRSYYAVTLSRFNSDGSLDTSFGAGGKVITDTGVTTEGAALAVQSDGKIIVAANAGSHPNRLTAILRYTSDGALDATFADSGVFFSSVMKVARDISILADDFIVVAGDSDVPNLGRTQVLKLNANGSLDTTFGNNGIASSTYFAGSDTNKMVIQPDGKIVTSGENLSTASKWLVHRFNTDGSPDSTFGTDGIREISASGSMFAGGLGLQPDGKIVVGGFNTVPQVSDTQIMLARLNSDGTTDASFSGGMVFRNLTPDYDRTTDVTIQPDGKILIAGHQSASQAMVARFDSTGAIDTNFGTGGVALFSPGSNTAAIALQGSNLVAIGSESSGAFFVARIDQAGTNLIYRNESFIVGKNDRARDVAIQPDGKIVTAGVSENTRNPVVSVARVLPNGNLDTTFGTGGRVTISSGISYLEAYAVEIQPDGKIVVAGRFSQSTAFSTYSLFVARLNADGSPDGNFGTGGRAIITTPSSFVGYDLELQPDGKILVGGTGTRTVGDGVSELDMMAARLNPNGTPDSGFGGNGVFIYASGSASSRQFEEAKAIGILPDGKIILAGTHLLKLNPDGTVDSSFSPAPVPLGFPATDVKLQPDGKILLGGGKDSDFALARYKSDASVDTDFGINGAAVLDFGGTDIANAIYLDPNGDILAGGSTLGGSPFRRRFALARFKPNGSPDTSFGSGGKIITDFGGDAAIFGLTRQTDGKIVAAGEAKVNIDRDYALARYFSRDFQIDFDGDGRTDVSIFRPSVGEWWILRGATGQTVAAQFGSTTDQIVPGDYTGDGKSDIAVWRESTGEWFILRSEDGSFFSFPFGMSGDIPAPSDYDGDGKTDAAVFRPSSGTWFILNSNGGGTSIVNFGTQEDKPVPADFDGDGHADIAIFRPSDGSWWYLQSSNSQFKVYRFGVGTDKPVQGDYTGDGRADIAIFRPQTGEWYFQRSEDNSYFSVPFGQSGDIPAPGDYDGDGKFDTAVFRPSNAVWYLQQSTGGFTAVRFGVGGDNPVPGAFVR